MVLLKTIEPLRAGLCCPPGLPLVPIGGDDRDLDLVYDITALGLNGPSTDGGALTKGLVLFWIFTKVCVFICPGILGMNSPFGRILQNTTKFAT